MRIPQILINARLYSNENALYGTTSSIQLPDVEYMAESIQGAGIGGEIEAVAVGMVKAMTVSWGFRSMTKQGYGLAAPIRHTVTAREAVQVLDSNKSQIAVQAVKTEMIVTPKKAGLGKLETGKPKDAEQEYACYYLRSFIDNQEVFEVSPLDFKLTILGTDYLAPVRAALGYEGSVDDDWQQTYNRIVNTA